jgi:formamidopyrimidine-DNA glycosylase
MPELPEVHTTVEGLRKTVVGKTITDVWSDFHLRTSHGHKPNIKNKKYLGSFKNKVVGAKIKSVERKGKNTIINLSNKHSVIVHMKMTGHLMVGEYEFKGKKWQPSKEGPLKDPFNNFLHFVLTLSSGKHLVLSDMRKFASVCFIKTKDIAKHPGLDTLGPDPLRDLSAESFANRIKNKNNWPIKTTLMDQGTIAGIGNIYSDEILWATGIHPLSLSCKMYANTKKILEKSIGLGGDSMSDYRNAFGEKGRFQNFHRAYRQTGKKCLKRGCGGIIKRMVVRGRSAHYCDIHQKRYGK